MKAAIFIILLMALAVPAAAQVYVPPGGSLSFSIADRFRTSGYPQEPPRQVVKSFSNQTGIVNTSHEARPPGLKVVSVGGKEAVFRQLIVSSANLYEDVPLREGSNSIFKHCNISDCHEGNYCFSFCSFAFFLPADG